MKLNERDLDKIKSLKYLIKSVLSNPDREDFEVFDCVMKMNDLALTNISQEKIDKYPDDFPELDDMKQIMEYFFIMLEKAMKNAEMTNNSEDLT